MSIERNIRINVSGGDTTGTANLLKLSNAVKVVAMGYAALRTAQKAVEFVKLGAQVQAAEYRLVKFADGTEEATRYLEALARGTDYTIDRMTAMQQASRMLETGMARNTYEMELAGAIVAKLGNQVLSTERRMMSLTMLLANQSTLRLDDFGISVEAVTARQKELAQQGMTTSEAFRQAFFEIAAKQLGILGDQSQTAATKIARVEAAAKNMKLELAETAMKLVDTTVGVDGLVKVMETVPEAAEVWFRLLPIWRELMRDNRLEAANLAGELQDWATATINAFEGMERVEGLGWLDPQVAEGWRDRGRALNEYAQAIEQTGQWHIGLAEQAHLTTASEEELAAAQKLVDEYQQAAEATFRQRIDILSEDNKRARDAAQAAREHAQALQAEAAAAMDTTAAMLDLAMSYASYYQQVGASATSYYGGLGDAEERYQERVKQIQEMGAGDLGGGGGATPGRKFDRGDIERGLRIQQARLAEAEAEQATWGMGEKLEGLSWEDISREDRKWLSEHGKTLEDLQAEHVKTGEDITELERAMMDDRIEDLKREIKETSELLERGHYEQSTFRRAAAARDTEALLAEAAKRRDEEIAMLEESRVEQERIHFQSLGRIKLEQFDAWVEMNLATDGFTKEEAEFVATMREKIALEYGLITTAVITELDAQIDKWGELWTSIEEGAQKATDAINAIPSRGDVYWGEILPPGTIEGKQSGGSVLGGRPYLVGETGPELFMPRQAGYVYNAQQSKQITSARDSHDTYIVSSDRAWQQIDQERRARARAAFTESAGM